jgi:hypothetical protein
MLCLMQRLAADAVAKLFVAKGRRHGQAMGMGGAGGASAHNDSGNGHGHGDMLRVVVSLEDVTAYGGQVVTLVLKPISIQSCSV